MNIMRKFRASGGGSVSTTATTTSPSSSSSIISPASEGSTTVSAVPATAVTTTATQSIDPSSSPHTQLGLMHLKKLFLEYTHPSYPMSDKEKNDKLYNMLPLFCKVFGSSPACDMNEKFWDILTFCNQVSILMVSEVSKRASNQSTESASAAIAKFLEIENCEESSNGWMLLSTLNLLAAGNATIVKTMAEVAIPSTLVKCLYLFFDLPEIVNEEEQTTTSKENGSSNSDFTALERRILLQKIFVQLLVRLCSHRIPAEELAKKDDLTLLFLAITSWCPSYNVIWRKSAAEVLMTLSRHGLTPPVVSYIHSKSCIAVCISNMKKVPNELTPFELVEMFVTVFCFLKDSSEISSILLDDFRQAQGYNLLLEFLLKLENDKSIDSQESIRNLVLMITSLCMCGYMELKPSQASTSSLFKMPNFILPQPANRGATVRNIQAFHILQNAFLKTNSTLLCGIILDAISNIYRSDNANYFILENQNTLSQFIEKIHQKPYEIQQKLFELVEFLVFTLNFVPCKELISMSILLKTHSLNYVECSIQCMKVLLNILKYNALFKDVYREVGLLEIYVTLLTRYAQLLEKKRLNPDQEKLGSLIIESLTLLLNNNGANANVLRECGGAKCVHRLVQYIECRYAILGIIKELILTSGGDEDMQQLLNTLHSCSRNELDVKIDILESLKLCLRESHRTRTVFRKANGFIYVTSTLIALENCLNIQHQHQSKKINYFLILVFQTLCTAMRFEPANAKLFHYDICKSQSLCDTLKLLGCFSNNEKINVLSDIDCGCSPPSNKYDDIFSNLFVGSLSSNINFPQELTPSLTYIIVIYRLLYDLALDWFDRPNNSIILNIRSPPSASLSRQQSDIQQQQQILNNQKDKRQNLNSLNLNNPHPLCDPFIVHPGVVICMFQLLPFVKDPNNNEAALSLQIFIADMIKSLMRSERNQQAMCDKDFVTTLLEIGSIPLQNENHPLHGQLQYMLERLASQALEPIDLRTFLRLGNPLCCLPLELPPTEMTPDDSMAASSTSGGPVPLTRIKTIVSMTTPKDFRAQFSFCTAPPFVEFDMSAEGFGCLYLPSIAPQSILPSSAAASVVSAAAAAVVAGAGSSGSGPGGMGTGNSGDNTIILSGIGSGDRIFPPQAGLSYSTWICVDKFSDPRQDPHSVHLLTLIRNYNGGKDDHIICLSIVLSTRDKAIIVSTRESRVPHNIVGDWEPDGTGEYGARVWYPELLKETQWHHIVVVLNRAVLKNSTFSLYIDGQQVHMQKMHYISQNPGGPGANLNMATSVYGYIGTPPAWRRYSKLCWKQGPCHLFEEVLTPTVVAYMYQLGPNYMGSFLAPNNHSSSAASSSSNMLMMSGTGAGDASTQFVSEEKVIFGLNAKAVSQLTLNKIRKVYSKLDNKSIAKQLGMSSHESATPIKILHNSAGHLAGAARTLGGVVIGYLGVRVFCPKPVAVTIDTVGGCSVLLGLIAMAQDQESLYAGVKALVCVVRSNGVAQAEMNRRKGYQTLAMLLRRKKHLLNSHILHLAFGLVGTVDSGRESSTIPNRIAFQDLLCDLEVWHEAPGGDLLRSHLEHLYELVTESNEKKHNSWLMRDLGLVEKLLHLTPDVKNSAAKQVLFSLLTVLLGGQPRPNDLLLFGQFIASTLTQISSVNEKKLSLNEGQPEAEIILLRNRCLSILHTLIFTNRSQMGEEITKILGFDWLMLFLQPNVHSSTCLISFKILIALCSNQMLISRFRDGSLNGGWLRYIDHPITGLVLNSGGGASAGGSSGVGGATSNDSIATNVAGFQYLSWLLPNHLDVPEIYYLLTALMMGQSAAKSTSQFKEFDVTKFDLDSVWAFLWGGVGAGGGASTAIGHHQHQPPINSVSPRINLCAEAVVVLLIMMRSLLHSASDERADWLNNHIVSIIQVLFQLYHNMPEFMPIFMSSEVLNALAAVLFPPISSKEDSAGGSPTSEVSTPITTTSDMMFIDPLDGDNNVGEPPLLTNHIARKFVIDFIRVILVDSLSLSVASLKTSPVIDLVLDAYPEDSSHAQQIAYQTEVLVTLMDHLLAADMLVGDQAAIPIVPLANADIQHVAPNVFYLTSRIVDKLWQGTLNRDPHEVFDFIVKLIGQAKRRTGNLSLEGLYHCLNRCILYLLSRSTDCSIADQMSVLEALHKLTTNRLIIFGAGNHELDFIGCLTYCLLQLTADMRIVLDVNSSNGNNSIAATATAAATTPSSSSSSSRTTWHVNPGQDLEPCDELLNVHQGRVLMATAAARVWEELYVCKKPAIEEVFKVTLFAPQQYAKAPDLTIVREQVYDAALKLWLNYIEGERKALYRIPWEFHNQLQSKIHKVAGGLTRLASRTKVVRKEEIRTRVPIDREKVFKWMLNNLLLVGELVEMRRQQHQNTTNHTQRYVHQEWLQTEIELTRERGLWGPPEPCPLDKWMLDMTEGPHRMRKKTTKNDLFYLHYPYRPQHEKGLLKYKVATSYDSKEYHQAIQWRQQHQYNGEGVGSSDKGGVVVQRLTSTSLDSPIASDISSVVELVGVEAIPPAASQAPPPATPSLPPLYQTTAILPPRLTRLTSDNVDDQQLDENENDDEQNAAPAPSDNQTLSRLLENNEKISYMFRVARIQGLDTTEGLLLFGQEHCYIVDGFTLLKNREIHDIDSCLPRQNAIEYEPILPNPDGSPRRTASRKMRQCSKFSYDDIREVHKRRYLLQPMALEVFSSDGRNYLLAFPRKQRNKVYQRFMATATSIADSAQQSVAGQKRTANVEQATSLLSNLIGETSVTQRWVRGEISNFQYLMHLNTLAGRSYNDLMQYPVFPWILANYDSEELDLNDPLTFRDFTKPMGAQNPERLEQFKKRFKEWDDPHGETPPYHYGTHYSSAMIVCSFLVRLEPFTQHFLRLQGGHFDLADRMFHSIKEAWLSASKHNMADVKELIPEFFYLPEFLLNSNKFDLGVKQNGVALGNVVLPPWAKQDSREFIRAHRMALECDYVSQNLHHWIDLIFGYKQQGQPAIDAINVFHHLFYEGNVDIYNIDDPLKKNATIGFINNFGQIPKQLFKKPHPCKRMGGNNNRTSVIDTGSLVQAFTLPQPEKLFFHHLDNLRPSLQSIKEVKGPVGQILQIDKSVYAVEQNKVLIPPSYNKYVAWGFADHSIRIGNYESDKAIFVAENVEQNNGEILTCVCPSPKLIITAGTSTVVTVWEYDARKKSTNIKHNLYAHTDAVTCLAASPAYNVIVSGSRDSTAIIWDLSRGVFVRQLRGHIGPVAAVAINELTGDIATCAATWLHVWSINGCLIAAINTSVGHADRMQQILCVAFSQAHDWDPLNVIITGSTDGVTRMWSIDYVQVPIEHDNIQEQQPPINNEISKNPATASAQQHHRLMKQIHVSSSHDSQGSLLKSGSESTLSEVENLGGTEEGCVKEWQKEQENEKEMCSDGEEGDDGEKLATPPLPLPPPTPPPIAPARRKKSNRANASFRKSEGGNSTEDTIGNISSIGGGSLDTAEDPTGGIRASKSDTSLTDSFVIVESNNRKRKSKINPLNILKPDFKWQRQLVFRNKLTMHTAYDRKDNTEPASITALAISKDHRVVYVGDTRGRIFSWSVTDSVGRTADHWLKDEVAENCANCIVKFTIYERRHHCRNCGQVFCSRCSRFESEISKLRILKPVRVCQSCYALLKGG